MNYKEELSKYVLKDAGMTCLELFKAYYLIVEDDPSVILKTVPAVNQPLAKYIANKICNRKGDMLQLPTACINALHAYHVDTIMKASYAGTHVREIMDHFSLNKKDTDLMEQILFAIIESPHYNISTLFGFLRTYPTLRYNKKIIDWCFANEISMLHKICSNMEDIAHYQLCSIIKQIRFCSPVNPGIYVTVAKLDPYTSLTELMYCFDLEPYTQERYSRFKSAFETIALYVLDESDLHEYLAFCLRIGDMKQIVATMDRFPTSLDKFIEHNSALYLPYIRYTKSSCKYRTIVKFDESAEKVIKTLRQYKFNTDAIYNPYIRDYESISYCDTVLAILHYIARFETIDGLLEFFIIGKAFHSIITHYIIRVHDKATTSLLFGLFMQLKIPNQYELVHDFIHAGHKHIIDQWIACCDDEKRFVEYVKLFPKDGPLLLYKTHIAWYFGNKYVQTNLARKKSKLHNELFSAISMRACVQQ